MVDTNYMGAFYLWFSHKIPEMKRSGESDEWWTHRNTVFWTVYAEEES